MLVRKYDSTKTNGHWHLPFISSRFTLQLRVVFIPPSQQDEYNPPYGDSCSLIGLAIKSEPTEGGNGGAFNALSGSLAASLSSFTFPTPALESSLVAALATADNEAGIAVLGNTGEATVDEHVEPGICDSAGECGLQEDEPDKAKNEFSPPVGAHHEFLEFFFVALEVESTLFIDFPSFLPIDPSRPAARIASCVLTVGGVRCVADPFELMLPFVAWVFFPVLEPDPDVLLDEVHLIDPLASERGLKSEREADESLSDGETGTEGDKEDRVSSNRGNIGSKILGGSARGNAVMYTSDCRGEVGGGWDKEVNEDEEDGGGGRDEEDEDADVERAEKAGGADEGGGRRNVEGALAALLFADFMRSALRVCHVRKFLLQCVRYMAMSGTALTVNSSKGFAKILMKKICEPASARGSSIDMEGTVVST